jgi:hypothetical protein
VQVGVLAVAGVSAEADQIARRYAIDGFDMRLEVGC